MIRKASSLTGNKLNYDEADQGTDAPATNHKDYFLNSNTESDAEDIRFRLRNGRKARSEIDWNQTGTIESPQPLARKDTFELSPTPRLSRRRSSKNISIGVAPRPRKSRSASNPHQSDEDPVVIDVSPNKSRRPRAPQFVSQTEEEPVVACVTPRPRKAMPSSLINQREEEPVVIGVTSRNRKTRPPSTVYQRQEPRPIGDGSARLMGNLSMPPPPDADLLDHLPRRKGSPAVAVILLGLVLGGAAILYYALSFNQRAETPPQKHSWY